jgi:endonuclease G
MTPLEILEQAARRWRQRAAEREQERAQPGVPAEAARRHALKVKRLNRAASEEKARALSLAAIIATPAHAAGKGAVVDSFSMERVLGKSDLVDLNFLELAIAMARPVARIRLRDGFGTGFLVAPSRLMTNHHVLDRPEAAQTSVAEFDFQQNRSGEALPIEAYRLEPGRLFHTDEALDFSLVAVAPASQRGKPLGSYGWVKLLADQGKAETGDCLNIIQHPRGQLKQIAFRENEVVDIFDSFLHYQTDTEPGSSGSPCFNDQWELVALHHSGVPKTDARGHLLTKANKPWRKGVDPPEELAWVANEGIRVSTIVKAVQGLRLSGEPERMLDEMFSANPPIPIELARTDDGTNVRTGAPAMAMQANSITLNIPLQVTISVGTPTGSVISAAAPALQPAIAVAATAAAKAAAAGAGAGSGSMGLFDFEEKIEIDPDYSNRRGYDANFLPGFKVALPSLPEALQSDAAIPKDASGPNAHTIPYHHYSVVLSKRRRMAIFTAVNLDGKLVQPLEKREQDKWIFDPRIDEAFQIGGEAYLGNALDRGHLVRRLDPAWGETKEIAKKGNDDTFHYTNCAPQHKDFNRNNDTWQGLEDFLMSAAHGDAKRLTIFTGPVFSANDPVYQGGQLKTPIRIPLEYWKVAVMIAANGHKSVTGYLLSQSDLIGDGTGLEERFEASVFQVTLAELERRTKLHFGDLKQFDPLKGNARVERLEAEFGAGHRIDSAPDIVI